MIKRFIITIFVALILGGSLMGYGFFRARERLRQERQNSKAPETQVTIIEGWSVKDIARYLENKNILQADSFMAAEKSFDAANYPLLVSKPKTADLEGFLFPDTYRIYKNSASSSQQIINKMLNNFSAKFTPAMEQQAAARTMSIYQIITLASIIEKESGADQTDKKVAAGIFYNRLNAGVPLQSDATVNYITGKSAAQASIEDTQINSPYNTYKYKGLPPGPICNPSLASIQAALFPTASDYFYFLTDPKSGRVIPAKTLDEHNQNKAKYLR